MSSLFITGAGGFVGARLLDSLKAEGRAGVTCLTRNPADFRMRLAPPPHWRIVEGDIAAPGSWSGEIAAGAVVVHLAAATGKASPAQHVATNLEGTGRLVDACAGAGVARLIHVSSIAAKFSDRAHYHYADTKLEAEKVVRAGGVPYVIVRPTVVLGSASPALMGLMRLAGGPVGVRLGNGRARMQPIDVTDLAAALLKMVDDVDLPLGSTIELGGPEVVTSSELLRRIRLQMRGRRGPFLPIPLSPLRLLLAALEGTLRSLLPLTAGQLASFANDGVATPHPWSNALIPRFRGIAAMLSPSTAHG